PSPRMRREIHLAEVLLGHERVDLRGGHAGMSEELLHHPNVGASLEQVRGEGVPERVRAHPLAEPGPANVPPEDPAAALPGQPPTPVIEEDRPTGRLRGE